MEAANALYSKDLPLIKQANCFFNRVAWQFTAEVVGQG